MLCLEIPFQRCPHMLSAKKRDSRLILMLYSMNHVNGHGMKEINIDYDLKMFCSLTERSPGLRTCKKRK